MHAAVLSEILMSDDAETKKAISELRRLSPLDRKWPVIFGHLLSKTQALAPGGTMSKAA